MQWLMLQMGGIGPMMGQANMFYRYFPEKIPATIDRYQGEIKRLLRVLDTQLAAHEYLAGDYSIANIANFAWVRMHGWAGVSIDTMPNLTRWLQSTKQRPKVQQGLLMPASKTTWKRMSTRRRRLWQRLRGVLLNAASRAKSQSVEILTAFNGENLDC